VSGPNVPSLLLWGLDNAILLACAIVATRPLRLGARALDAAVVLFGWILLATLITLLCGWAGHLRPLVITACCAALAAALAVAGWTGRLPARSAAPEPRAPRRRAERWLRRAAFVLLALQAVRLAVHVWLLPPYVGDVLVYHLPNVAEWIQQERIVVFDAPAKRTFWPASFALLQTWFVLFPRHDFLIDAAGVPYLALAVLAVYSCARSLRVRPGLALLIAALYAYTPAVALHATSCNNDLPIAAAFLLLCALALDGWRRGGRALRRGVIAWLGLALAFGTKAYIAFVAPGLVWLAFWCWLKSPARAPARAPSPPSSPLPLSFLTVAAAIGLLLGVFWYARNAIVFGNPFYPTDFRLFGHLICGTGTGLSQQGTFRLAGLWENLIMLFGEKIFDRWWPFHADLARMTGWGWFSFTCGPPALVYAVVRSAPMRAVALAFVIALLALLGCVTPDVWNMRFCLWFPALFALAFGVTVERLRPLGIRRALLALALLCAALDLVGTLNIGKARPEDWRRMAELPVAQRSAAELGLFTGPTYRAALRTIPADAKVAYNIEGNVPLYPLYDADFSRDPVYVPIEADTDIPAAMRERGVRYLFVHAPPRAAQRRVDEAVAAGLLQPLGEEIYYVPTR
jgi:hypothetical protein